MAETSLFDAHGLYHGSHGGAPVNLRHYGGTVSVTTVAKKGDEDCGVNLSVHSGGA